MNDRHDRLFELLATRATEGLPSEEAHELERLLEAAPDVDPEDFDRAAAAAHLALLGPEQPMPAELKRRIVSAGVERLAPAGAPATGEGSAGRTPWPGSYGWWAAAAALAVALIGWWPRLQPAPEAAPESARTAAPESAPLLEDPATLRLPWTTTEDATAVGASGEVVWNNDLQTGYMRLAGLETNDPAEFQYQLWIFDRARDERYPVDGGVFDVSAEGGDVVVPIDAKIRVNEPYLFAVTVEPPGGVVVSSRERIALLAQA